MHTRQDTHAHTRAQKQTHTHSRTQKQVWAPQNETICVSPSFCTYRIQWSSDWLCCIAVGMIWVQTSTRKPGMLTGNSVVFLCSSIKILEYCLQAFRPGQWPYTSCSNRYSLTLNVNQSNVSNWYSHKHKVRVVPDHSMKTYKMSGRNDSIHSLLRYLIVTGQLDSSATLPRGRTPGTHCILRRVSPRAVWTTWRNHSCSSMGSKPGLSSSYPSPYTDCAFAAPFKHKPTAESSLRS